MIRSNTNHNHTLYTKVNNSKLNSNKIKIVKNESSNKLSFSSSSRNTKKGDNNSEFNE